MSALRLHGWKGSAEPSGFGLGEIAFHDRMVWRVSTCRFHIDADGTSSRTVLLGHVNQVGPTGITAHPTIEVAHETAVSLAAFGERLDCLAGHQVNPRVLVDAIAAMPCGVTLNQETTQ